MGGGKKEALQSKAETTSSSAVEAEKLGATNLQSELEKRRSIVGSDLPEVTKSTATGATDLRASGGFDPKVIDPIRSGYTDLSTTGGFSPTDKTNFLRKAISPVTALYSRAKDELIRRKAIQGGYSPGFDASTARVTRQAANAGADASLNANVDLAGQVRTGKVTGLQGQANLAGMEQQGKIAGQDALQRFTTGGIAALSDVDVNEMRNRLQTGQMSQADAQLLTQLASQHKSLFDQIMQGVSAVGGATAGIMGAR